MMNTMNFNNVLEDVDKFINKMKIKYSFGVSAKMTSNGKIKVRLQGYSNKGLPVTITVETIKDGLGLTLSTPHGIGLIKSFTHGKLISRSINLFSYFDKHLFINNKE